MSIDPTQSLYYNACPDNNRKVVEPPLVLAHSLHSLMTDVTMSYCHTCRRAPPSLWLFPFGLSIDGQETAKRWTEDGRDVEGARLWAGRTLACWPLSWAWSSCFGSLSCVWVCKMPLSQDPCIGHRRQACDVQVVETEDGKWKCEYDGAIYDTMVRRYIMQACFADFTGEAVVYVFNDQVCFHLPCMPMFCRVNGHRTESAQT